MNCGARYLVGLRGLRKHVTEAKERPLELRRKKAKSPKGRRHRQLYRDIEDR